jgi:hypothetical protein
MVLLAIRCHAGKAQALGLTNSKRWNPWETDEGRRSHLTQNGAIPERQDGMQSTRSSLSDRGILAARCVEHDLVVSPKALEEIQGSTFAFAALHCNSHDRGHGSIAINGGEQPVLKRIDGEDEIGECMRLVDQYGYATRGQTFPDAYRPGQPDRNIIAPTGPGEGDRLALVGAIVAVCD